MLLNLLFLDPKSQGLNKSRTIRIKQESNGEQKLPERRLSRNLSIKNLKHSVFKTSSSSTNTTPSPPRRNYNASPKRTLTYSDKPKLKRGKSLSKIKRSLSVCFIFLLKKFLINDILGCATTRN